MDEAGEIGDDLGASERLVILRLSKHVNKDKQGQKQTGTPEDSNSDQMQDSIRVVVKAPSLTGNKKVRFKGFSGPDYSVARRRFVQKSEHIDVENDRRVEFIYDPVTGEILKDVDHSLRKDHQGYGSAKYRKK